MRFNGQEQRSLAAQLIQLDIVRDRTVGSARTGNLNPCSSQRTYLANGEVFSALAAGISDSADLISDIAAIDRGVNSLSVILLSINLHLIIADGLAIEHAERERLGTLLSLRFPERLEYFRIKKFRQKNLRRRRTRRFLRNDGCFRAIVRFLGKRNLRNPFFCRRIAACQGQHCRCNQDNKV
ncbi:hypothetical protein D3C77_315300 [compost metagenome]